MPKLLVTASVGASVAAVSVAGRDMFKLINKIHKLNKSNIKPKTYNIASSA
jgi:hypothetical protein